MNSQQKKMIFCLGERLYFPEDQFRPDNLGNFIHKVQPEHYAADGSLVNPVAVPIPETIADLRNLRQGSNKVSSA